MKKLEGYTRRETRAWAAGLFDGEAVLSVKLSGYTPGPWTLHEKLSGSENHKGFTLWAAGQGLTNGRWLADVSPQNDENGDPSAEGKATAALIAQAPTLLEQRDKLAEALRVILECRAMVYTNWSGDIGRGENVKHESCICCAADLNRNETHLGECHIAEAERVLREVGDGK